MKVFKTSEIQGLGISVHSVLWLLQVTKHQENTKNHKILIFYEDHFITKWCSFQTILYQREIIIEEKLKKKNNDRLFTLEYR